MNPKSLLLLSISALANAQSPTMIRCGLASAAIHEAIRSWVFWMEPGMTRKIMAHRVVPGMCSIRGHRAVLSLPALNVCVAAEKIEDKQIVTSVDGCVIADEKDLWGYFVSTEQTDSKMPISMSETWRRARESVDKLRIGARGEMGVQMPADFIVERFTYRAPTFRAPSSQRNRLFDAEVWNRVLPKVKERVQKPYCPCRIGLPYFNRNDPLLLIYVRYSSGEETILAVRRLFDKTPILQLTPAFYDRYDPGDRALLKRLKNRLVRWFDV